MEISADHLFGVNGVEAGQKASSSLYVFTVLLSAFKVLWCVIHQLVTPAVPWDPTMWTLCFFILKRLCREGERQIEAMMGRQVNFIYITPNYKFVSEGFYNLQTV